MRYLYYSFYNIYRILIILDIFKGSILVELNQAPEKLLYKNIVDWNLFIKL